MDVIDSKTNSEVDTAGEEVVTDSLADILSSSTESLDSSLTSLTSDNLLQQMTTEDETLKVYEDSDIETDLSFQSSAGTQSTHLPNLNTQDWYLHPLFQRYWKHYAHSMSWCQNHQIITEKLKQRGHVYQRHSEPYSRSFLSNCKSQNLKTSKHPMFKTTQGQNHSKKFTTTGQQKATVSEDSTTCDETHLSDADSEVYEMEITEEMVDFFAKSEKHRKERDELKHGPNGKNNNSLVDIGQASKKIPTSEAPKERPGLRRTTEMTQIYGKGAAMIHGMETALQMTYDRNIDIKQPPFWPNMPLKIIFK